MDVHEPSTQVGESALKMIANIFTRANVSKVVEALMVGIIRSY